MNTKKYLKYSILPLALMLGGLAFTACTDDIEGGKPVDEGAYDAVKRVDGMLLDVTSNKNESVIELRSDKHQTEVFFRLTKAPQKGVDVKIEMDPAYLESVREEREKWAAYELYEEQMTAKYGASEWQWPLEVRKEHNQRAEACGLYNHWVDDLPRPGDITQEEALTKAHACFEAMWDRPVSEGWHTVMAFGYNRMQPTQRLWEVRYSQEPEENGGPFFLIQLRAEDGMLQRTSDTEEFANYLVTNGESWEELLLEWEERRGCPFDEWTLEQQYEFAQLPLVQLSGALTDVTLPRPGDVAEEDALNVARMAIVRKYGVSEAELDAMKLRKVARKSTGEWGWYYGLAWCSWVEEEQVWGVVYDAYIDMGMGTVLLLQGPGEGNG